MRRGQTLERDGRRCCYCFLPTSRRASSRSKKLACSPACDRALEARWAGQEHRAAWEREPVEERRP